MRSFNFYIKTVSFVFISLFFIGCGGSDDGSTIIPNPPRTAADVREDFSKLTFNTGVNDVQLESVVEGVFWNFRVIVPEGASLSNKMPLVLRLHGAARANSPDAHKSTDCLVTPGFEDLDTYIISPNSNGAFWYDQENIVQVLALLDLSKDNFHIDENKVVVMGFSDGGNGSWFYAQYYSSLFSAAIPMATSYNSEDGNGEVNAIEIPLYVIHGSADEWFPIESTVGYVDASIDAGSDIQFIIADGLVHIEPCDYVSYLQDAVIWLETEVWD